MASGMAGNVQDHQAAISKIIIGLIPADLVVVTERCFDHIAVLEVCFEQTRILLGWIAWEKAILETRTNDQISRWVEPGDVSTVIKMPSGGYGESCVDLQNAHTEPTSG